MCQGQVQDPQGSAECEHGRCFGIRIAGNVLLSPKQLGSELLPAHSCPASLCPTPPHLSPKCHPLPGSGAQPWCFASPAGTLAWHGECASAHPGHSARLCARTRSAMAVVCQLLCGL